MTSRAKKDHAAINNIFGMLNGMSLVTEQEAAKFYNSRPRKRAGAGILIFNKKDELLLVKPNYLAQWLCPGGGIEENEAPLAAAKRECEEEIGVTFDDLWPAYINYREAQPDGQVDMIQFMFTTNPVESEFIKTLTLQQDEIDDAKFVPINQLPDHLSAARAKTIMAYCSHRKSRNVVYLENGEVIG